MEGIFQVYYDKQERDFFTTWSTLEKDFFLLLFIIVKNYSHYSVVKKYLILELSSVLQLVDGEAITCDWLVKVLQTADGEAVLCKIKRFLASILTTCRWNNSLEETWPNELIWDLLFIGSLTDKKLIAVAGMSAKR